MAKTYYGKAFNPSEYEHGHRKVSVPETKVEEKVEVSEFEKEYTSFIETLKEKKEEVIEEPVQTAVVTKVSKKKKKAVVENTEEVIA